MSFHNTDNTGVVSYFIVLVFKKMSFHNTDNTGVVSYLLY